MTSATCAPAVPGIPSPRHRFIEQGAYQKWMSKGCPSGTALQDWLEAEAEMESGRVVFEDLWQTADDLATIAQDVSR